MVMGLGGSAIAAGGPAVPKATMAAITAEKAAAGLTRRCASFVARHTGRLPSTSSAFAAHGPAVPAANARVEIRRLRWLVLGERKESWL